MSIDDIKALAALGATEVTIHPDGRIVAKFEKPAAPPQVVYVPTPYVVPTVNPPQWWAPYSPPYVTWCFDSADNNVPEDATQTLSTWNGIWGQQ
jgi:hypothetical protein